MRSHFPFGAVASDSVRANELAGDPSSKIQKVYIEFIEFYTLARRETLKESELKQLHRLGLDLQETLKAELPERRRPFERAQAARAASAATRSGAQTRLGVRALQPGFLLRFT